MGFKGGLDRDLRLVRRTTLSAGNSIPYFYSTESRYNVSNMCASPIYLSASTDAVDASLVTKDFAIKSSALGKGIPLSRVAGIGDSANDLPFLRISGLGLVGAPSNAQTAVKQALKAIRGAYLSPKSFFEGFLDFYSRCTDQGIELVFTDRDGVLIWNENGAAKAVLRPLLELMGQDGRPFIIILTGSSYEQNVDFMRHYQLNAGLGVNPRIRENPYIIYAENGAVQIDILGGSSRNYAADLDSTLLGTLTHAFLHSLLHRIREKVLPAFQLGLSEDRSDQHSKLYLPPKRTMVTVNLPRSHLRLEDYRQSPESDTLRQALLQEMVLTAQELHLPYEVLT